MRTLPRPGPENLFLLDHISLVRRNLRAYTGRDLIETEVTEAEAARLLYHAPFVLLTHNQEPDPILTYGNLASQELFELSWKELTAMPSRLTAEAPDRNERARLLARVAENGWIDDYTGVRVSSNGKRFRIEHALVWNLIDEDGRLCGQAACFSRWERL